MTEVLKEAGDSKTWGLLALKEPQVTAVQASHQEQDNNFHWLKDIIHFYSLDCLSKPERQSQCFFVGGGLQYSLTKIPFSQTSELWNQKDERALD